MKILLMGGPRFLGYALIESALDRGHEVTMFNRGKTAPNLFPGLERIIGDRDGGLNGLLGRSWDAVIDTSGYLPRIVGDSARLLKDFVGQYLFVSSISVYQQPIGEPYDESLSPAVLEDPTVEDITGETYGALKALCENAVEKAVPGRALIIRPGLIVGPRDPSDRFTYWPIRGIRGGRVLAPGNPGDPCQLIDVRDLAGWMISLIESGKNGVYNATSTIYTMEEVLQACMETASNQTARLHWVSSEFLKANNVGEWMELPLWLTGEARDTMRVSVEKAVRDGLKYRPLVETARDTLEWAHNRSASHQWQTGISPERENQLLQDWELQSNG